MRASEIEGVLEFLRAAESLKNTLRSSWTSEGRPESVAQHTWRLCLMALVFADSYPDVDFAKLVRICIIHDLGEAIGGDIPAIAQVPGVSKAAQERADLLELLRPLPERIRGEITALWDEYEAATSPEARLAKALDKLETIMQHNQGKNPSGFDYGFNLEYGKRYTAGDPLIETVRAILDRETARRAEESAAGGGA
ncbi:MAG TPA: HD domain-containing protein [Longimicrobiales bacterium]|nr:HD domain-containing protein [Longimicrobiales bacterium]